MTFSVRDLAPSLAKHLKTVLPDVTFYRDPAQQGVQTAAMFLQVRHASVSPELRPRDARRDLRKIGLDLITLLQPNLPDALEKYHQIAEQLDLSLSVFPLVNSAGESELVRPINREWRVELDSLHYRFDLWLHADIPETVVPMQTMQLIEQVTV